MTEYVDRERVLWLISQIQTMAEKDRIRKTEILPLLKAKIIDMDRKTHVSPVTQMLEDFVPAVPYSVLSRKTWRCGECDGEVWYKDRYCRHCGAKLEGEVVSYGQWHPEALEGV